MRKRDRSTLRKFFADGALPSAEHYSDLVESMVNRVDDGFDKPIDHGLRLSSLGSDSLISFYRGEGENEPSWTLRHGKTAGAMHFERGGDTGASHDADQEPSRKTVPPALALSPHNRVGINRGDPEWPLDVDGVVRMTGRIGAVTGPKEVLANGVWHDITPRVGGCLAYEVIAGVGGPVHQGRYSLMHAIALNAYNPGNPLLNWLFRRRSIKKQSAVYGSWADRIRLRWEGSSYNYALQMRTNARFPEGMKVRYHVTQLWFDPTMSGSRPRGTEGAAEGGAQDGG